MERIVLTPGGSWQVAAERAADVLRGGGVALLPAEGVYGLHALAQNPAGVERLGLLKRRARDKHFIGLIADPEEMGRWAEASPRALALAREYWPGALTIVLRASSAIPMSMRHENGTIALRCPGSAFLREVVAVAGGVVLSTSANEPGQPPAIRPVGKVAESADLMVDQGQLSGEPSTVVAVEGDQVRVLREGAVRLSGRRT
jgi:L-threonylcarbamoyladenylate synthase